MGHWEGQPVIQWTTEPTWREPLHAEVHVGRRMADWEDPAELGRAEQENEKRQKDLGGSSCMVKDGGKGRKMTGFQRHQKIVVLMDILNLSQTNMAGEFFYKNDVSHGPDREEYCLVTILCARPRGKTFICVGLMCYSRTHEAGCRKMEPCRIYTRNLVPLSGLRDRDGSINK